MNPSSGNGMSIKTNYAKVLKTELTKLVDEKVAIIEDFVRKNDLSPKEIVLENKEDIKQSTEILQSILHTLMTDIKIIETSNEKTAQLLDRTIHEAKEKIVDKFEFTMSDTVRKELNAVKSVLDAFLIDLRKLDSLKELENLKNLDILKKLEALESLDKLQDLDKLKDLSYIEKLQELDKLQKIDSINFKDIETILSIIKTMSEELPKGYIDIIEIIKANRDMIIDKMLLNEDNIKESIIKYLDDMELCILERINDNKFIEVFDKKELPYAGENKNKKAIVYGGFGGSSLYKSNGVKWIKI